MHDVRPVPGNGASLFPGAALCFVVLETGLGGRLDSTSGLSQVPLVSVVTNIGLDHVQILGDTLGGGCRGEGRHLQAGDGGDFRKNGRRRPPGVLIKRCEELEIPWRDAGKRRRGPGLEGQIPGRLPACAWDSSEPTRGRTPPQRQRFLM